MGGKRAAVPADIPAYMELEKIEKMSWRERAFPYLFASLIFLSIASQGGRVFAILLTAVLMLFAIGKQPFLFLKERLTTQFLAVSIYAGLCFGAGLYSDFGSLAMRETAKTLSAYVMFALAVLCLKKDNIRLVWQAIAGSCAIFGLISIDGSSLNVLTPAFAAFMRLFNVEYDVSTMGYEVGVRITGVFSNANVSAGVLAFGILSSLYLLSTAQNAKRRFWDYLMLGVNAMAFFLSFSMGAMAAFGISCVVYLMTIPREERPALFLTMLETIIVTVALAFLAYAYLGKIGAVSLIPLFCAAANGVLIGVIHRFAGEKLLVKMAGRGKIAGIVSGALCGLLVLYVALAMNLTGGITLSAGEKFSRAAYLNAGEYTVSAEHSVGTDVVTIYSQNESELMMHTQTVLYSGTLDKAEFAVPKNSKIVWFDMAAGGNGSTLTAVTLSDGTALKLGYRLLPGFAANRLQGVGANQNFIQRLVFFQDGIKLWKQSPIFGFGLAGVEGRLTQVQSFYYETKYIHNHFIQVLDEMGLLGLASFVFLLSSAIVLLAHQRKKKTSLFAVLAACMTMMTTHSLTEVIWSTAMYQIITFLILAVILISYGKPIAWLSRRATLALIGAGMCMISAVSALLLGGTMLAAKKMQAIQNGEKSISTRVEFLDAMQGLIRMDVYNNETYKVNYICNALAVGSSLYLGQADTYADQMRATKEYTACSDAATYYDLPSGRLDDFFADSQAAITQEASNKDAWNNQIKIYKEAFSSLKSENMKEYVSGILSVQERLKSFNNGRMEQIALTEENQQFLELIHSLQGKSEDQIFSELTQQLKQ